MEFEGRIQRVLPVRSGTSRSGNDYMALPFVFEYFEDANQRTSDKVLLETNDRSIIAKIGAYLKKGADKKAVVENGECVLMGELRCKIGFSHSVRQYTKNDGTQGLLNNICIYRFDVLGAAVVQQQTGQAVQAAVVQQQTGQAVQAAMASQQTEQAVQQPGLFQQTQQTGQDSDDLPF